MKMSGIEIPSRTSDVARDITFEVLKFLGPIAYENRKKVQMVIEEMLVTDRQKIAKCLERAQTLMQKRDVLDTLEPE